MSQLCPCKGEEQYFWATPMHAVVMSEHKLCRKWRILAKRQFVLHACLSAFLTVRTSWAQSGVCYISCKWQKAAWEKGVQLIKQGCVQISTQVPAFDVM